MKMKSFLAFVVVIIYTRSVDGCGFGLPLFSGFCGSGTPACPPTPVCPPPPVCAQPPPPPVQIVPYIGSGSPYGGGGCGGGSGYGGGGGPCGGGGGGCGGGGGYSGSGGGQPCSGGGGGGGCGGGGGGGYGGGGYGGGGYSSDCCSSCRYSCRFRRFRISGAPTNVRGVDPKCNSEKLRKIMLENMSADTTVSKRAIQKGANNLLKGKFDVVCSTGDLSYVVNSNLFCLETYGGATCYAFRHD